MSQCERDKAAVHSFPSREFKPTKTFFFNEHVQTILGSGAIAQKLFGPPPRPYTTTQEIIETADGDIFEVEFTADYDKVERIVIVVHGLESSSTGTLVTNFATGFLEKGFSCCLVNFRGCGTLQAKLPGGYHVGFTKDLHQLTAIIQHRHPRLKMYLAGFSLGGNVSLKFLGELGEKARERNVFGAVVTCVPFDPVASHFKLDAGFNRLAYSLNFLTTLIKRAEEEYKKFPGMPIDIEAVRQCKTIGDFDDRYVAKMHGFRDKFDYYLQNGSKWWLPKIRVPTVAINAIDDPFIDERSLPTFEDIGDEAPVRCIYQTYGGHCGFATDHCHVEDKAVPSHGWLADEMSRVLVHFVKHEPQDESDPRTGGMTAEKSECVDRGTTS